MKNNVLLELSGAVNLIATAICDFNTPTKSYKKGDIVLNLKDIDAQLITQNKSSQATSKVLDLEYVALHLSSILLQYVPLDRQLYSLLSNKANIYNIVCNETLVCVTNNVILPIEYIENIDSIRIDGVTNFEATNNEEQQVTFITSDEFEEGTSYSVQYEKTITGQGIVIDSFDADIPYLKLQLAVEGNINKKTDSAFVFVDKASMHFIPTLTFDNKGVTYCSIRFNVVESSNKPLLVI